MASGIQFCQHKNFGGKCVTYDVGKYNDSQLKSSVGNDAISSIRILSPGYYAKTYVHKDFTGGEQDFASDITDLKNYSWNDKISSLEVVNGNPPSTPSSPGLPTSTPPSSAESSIRGNTTAAPVAAPAASPAPTPVAPQLANPDPMSGVNSWSGTTWVLIAVFILFFLLIITGVLIYVMKRRTSAKPAEPSPPLATAETPGQ